MTRAACTRFCGVVLVLALLLPSAVQGTEPSRFQGTGHATALAVQEANGTWRSFPVDVRVEVSEGSGRTTVEGDASVDIAVDVAAEIASQTATDVYRIDRATLDFRVRLQARGEDLAGPSIGAPLALASLDALRDGLGHKPWPTFDRLAATGSIHIDGSFGGAAGVLKKLEAAHADGAAYVILPVGMNSHDAQEADAACRDFNITCHRVETLIDAATALHATIPPTPRPRASAIEVPGLEEVLGRHADLVELRLEDLRRPNQSTDVEQSLTEAAQRLEQARARISTRLELPAQVALGKAWMHAEAAAALEDPLATRARCENGIHETERRLIGLSTNRSSWPAYTLAQYSFGLAAAAAAKDNGTAKVGTHREGSESGYLQLGRCLARLREADLWLSLPRVHAGAGSLDAMAASLGAQLDATRMIAYAESSTGNRPQESVDLLDAATALHHRGLGGGAWLLGIVSEAWAAAALPPAGEHSRLDSMRAMDWAYRKQAQLPSNGRLPSMVMLAVAEESDNESVALAYAWASGLISTDACTQLDCVYQVQAWADDSTAASGGGASVAIAATLVLAWIGRFTWRHPR